MFRGSERLATPMPGIGWEPCSPLKELVPIELLVGSSKDKGKGKAVEAMDKGKLEREWSVSLTMSEYKGHWRQRGSYLAGTLWVC